LTAFYGCLPAARDPRAHWWQAASRRIKDTAFFGIRALWT
jgi:hypothetical protein